VSDHKEEGRRFAAFLDSLSEEEIRKGNEKDFQRAQEAHQRFKTAFARGECFLCQKPLASFSKKRPCLHWLLRPKRFKKKHFQELGDRYGFFRTQSYLRWVANQEVPFRNINDLALEDDSKLFELTIKWRNIVWAFSCSPSDYDGHPTSQYAKHAHFHFEMRVDGNPLIRFNDFHVPFSRMDLINIEAMRARPDKIRKRFSFGEGMSEVLTDEVVAKVLESPPTSGNHQEAPISIDSFAYAEEGKTIKGEDLYNLIQEAKQKGVTVASLLHKLPNATAKVIVSPGPGVVEMSERSGRGSGSSKDGA